jgi:hypothetical protein
MVFIQTEWCFLRRRHFRIFLLVAVHFFEMKQMLLFGICILYTSDKALIMHIENKCKVYLYDFYMIH